MSFLFDENILNEINHFDSPAKYSEYNPLDINKNLKLRPLSLTDFDKGIYDVLSDLTVIGEVNKYKFQEQFMKMKSTNSYFTIVIEDLDVKRIIASGSIILQYGLTRSCGTRGLIEDIAVSSDYQGQQLGKLLLNCLVLLGKRLDCYKLILHCTKDKEAFYEKFGFRQTDTSMTLRF